MEEGKWYNWTAGIVTDIFELSGRLETVVIGTSTPDIVPAIINFKNKGIKTIVIACGINRELKLACDQWIEVEEGMLENGQPKND